jgi:deazaflavin-dependent oxidoreductase (nitroreductase family)
MRIPDSFFVVVNRMVRLMLESPLHAAASGSLMLITFTGRKSGKTYTTPVRYLERDGVVWAFTSLDTKWWRNLEGGAPVRLRIGGEERAYRAEAIANAPDTILPALREFLSRFPQDAPYYEVGLTSDRRPVEADLARAAPRTVWVRAQPQPA